MSDPSDDNVDTRKIEKRRSWSQISSSASSVSTPSNDDYAIELDLFERGEIDKSLWAKHLVETKGDKEEAKWLYVKERVTTAPARRAEQERVKAQEEERRRRIAEQKAAEEENRRREEEKQKAAEEERRRRIAEQKAAEEEARRRAEEKQKARAIQAAQIEKNTLYKGLVTPAFGLLGFFYFISALIVGLFSFSVFASGYEGAALAGLFLLSLATVFMHLMLRELSINRGKQLLILLISFSVILGTCSDYKSKPTVGESEGSIVDSSQAGALINESWANFVGLEGPVDEDAALKKVNSAITLLEGATFTEAEKYLALAYNNLGVIYSCSVDDRVRDKDLAASAYAQVANMESYFIESVMWSVFWGGSLADSVNTPEQYYYVDGLISDWVPIQFRERYLEKTPLEVLKLMDEKRSEVPLSKHIAAQQIAFYFECRAESQDIGLAIEWYRTALERYSDTPEPTVLSPEKKLDEELEAVLTDLRLTWERQKVNERLMRLEQIVADNPR